MPYILSFIVGFIEYRLYINANDELKCKIFLCILLQAIFIACLTMLSDILFHNRKISFGLLHLTLGLILQYFYVIIM